MLVEDVTAGFGPSSQPMQHPHLPPGAHFVLQDNTNVLDSHEAKVKAIVFFDV